MKKFFLSVLAFAAVCGSAQAQKTPSVAVVNLSNVVREYNKAQDQAALLQKDALEIQQWAQKKEANLAELQKAAEAARTSAGNSLLNEQGRAAAKATFEQRAKEFQERQNEYAQEIRARQEMMNARQQQMTSNTLEEIRPVVAAIAGEKGADLVLNSEQALFAAPSLDVTTIVIKRLNDAYGPRVVQNPVPPNAANAAQPAAGAAAAPAASSTTPPATR